MMPISKATPDRASIRPAKWCVSSWLTFDRTPIRGQGANATLHFFGSAVYVYGAKRAHYVSHSVYLLFKLVSSSSRSAGIISGRP
jgi:hypothetical protein